MLMKEHGILSMGHDMTAYYLADLIEDTAKIAFSRKILNSSNPAFPRRGRKKCRNLIFPKP
jgi:ribulose-5-phosphate 4-epimerase/fuculose-1-phosphate aldolase